MVRYFRNLYKVWAVALSQKEFVRIFIPTMAGYLVFFKVFRVAAENMELRTGAQLDDWLLNLLPPTDFSEITFLLTYFALIFFLVIILPHPKRFVLWIQAYTMLLIFRMTTIYLVPLEPPTDMILLIDPMSNFFMKSNSESGYVVKDLFFSGHISAIFLFFLASIKKTHKSIFLLLSLVVSALILLQHVHYTVDIVAAPFFSVIAYRIALALNTAKYTSTVVVK